MALRQILTEPNKILREKSLFVEKVDKDLQKLMNDMLETMILATADPVIYEINTEDYLQGKLGTGRVDALRSLSTALFPSFELIGSDFFLPNDPSGIVSPGDELEVMVILLNHENWGTATNIIGTLSTNSNNIS